MPQREYRFIMFYNQYDANTTSNMLAEKTPRAVSILVYGQHLLQFHYDFNSITSSHTKSFGLYVT